MLLLLLTCWIITGIVTEVPSMIHYGQKNSSMCLHVQKSSPNKKGVKWTLKEKVIVFENAINPNFTKKVVYSPGNLSLCLNELTDTDNGIYEVSFMDFFTTISETHEVIVEEMVPRPVMIMSGLQSNLSAGFCNITVNCSIHDKWLWFECEGESCRTSQKSFSKFNITIYTDNGTVVCSANNHVSRNDTSQSIAMCFHSAESENKEEPQNPFILALVTAVLIFLCICAFLIKKLVSAACHRHRTRTRTAQVIQSQPVEARPQSEPRVSTSSSSSQAEPCYENVDVPQPNQTSSPRVELGSKQSHQVDTVYSILQMPKAAASLDKNDSSKDTRGHENREEGLTSIALDEAQSPIQVDTLYSVLQKPKTLSHSTTNR
ncbi:SLAM family member 9 [Stegastes partitus]|uniref:SLAM family member 9 n=1 Tax=Stegastes partitus TaxID=144197 RepID=A0A9Y4NEC0_9TELE|nr:PREDICTED: SLAM family member 9-like [Stegastes partitus]